MSSSRFPLILASESHLAPAMDPNRAETIEYQEKSLRKMSIAFLTSNEPGVQVTGRRTTLNHDGGVMDGCVHQQDNLMLPIYGLHPGDRANRVGCWVASQSLALATDSDSGYAVDSEDGMLCSGVQWPRGRFNEDVDVTSALESITPPNQQGVDSGKVPLADTELARLRDFTSPTPKRSRSPRSVYTKKEKLFIMHSRVIGDVSWQDISRTFEIIFGKRNTKHTMSSLRSIYYRTRRDWGMDYVTRSGPSKREKDQMVVSVKLSEYAGEPYSSWVASHVAST